MLKKIIFTFLLLQGLNSFALDKKQDNFGPKNIIESGLTCVNLFNHQGFLFIDPLANGYISYTRVLAPQHFFFKIDHHSYSEYYRHHADEGGSVVASAFHIARVSLGKVWTYKKWRFAPYASIDYRKGFGDYVQLTKAYWESPYAIFPYKSLGTGIGGSVNYRIGERFTVGFETHMDYFFQKNNLKEDLGPIVSADFNYQPNKMALISHFKFGLLF